MCSMLTQSFLLRIMQRSREALDSTRDKIVAKKVVETKQYVDDLVTSDYDVMGGGDVLLATAAKHLEDSICVADVQVGFDLLGPRRGYSNPLELPEKYSNCAIMEDVAKQLKGYQGFKFTACYRDGCGMKRTDICGVNMSWSDEPDVPKVGKRWE